MFVFHFDFHCHCHASSTFAHHTTSQCYRLGGEKIGAVIGVVGHYHRLSTVLISTLNFKLGFTLPFKTKYADCRHYCEYTYSRQCGCHRIHNNCCINCKNCIKRTLCMVTWHSVQVCHAVHQFNTLGQICDTCGF